MLLALDTATATASLALYDLTRDTLVAEWTWQARRRHTQDLLGAAQTLLQQAADARFQARHLCKVAAQVGALCRARRCHRPVPQASDVRAADRGE